MRLRLLVADLLACSFSQVPDDGRVDHVLDGIMRWITVDLALSARHAELAHRRIEALRLRYGLTGDAPRTYLDIAALTGAGGCQTGARRVA